MRLLDLVPLVCLGAYLGLSLATESTPRNAGLWFSALAALGFGLYAVDHGRWQAWGVVAAAALAFTPLIRAVLIERAVPAVPRSFASWIDRVAVALLSVGTAWLFWCLPALDFPRPTGPFKIGTTSFDLVDSARIDLFAPAPEPRRIQVRAWYPADPPVGAPPRRYLVGDEARLYAGSFARQTGLPVFFWDQLQLVRTSSVAEVPVLPGTERLPVVVFNHGYWSFSTQNTVLMETLASHGYLVLSIAHPYDASGVAFSDGRRALLDQSRTMAIAIQGETIPGLDEYLSAADPVARAHGMAIARAQVLDSVRMFTSSPVWRDDIGFLLEAIARARVPGLAGSIVARADTGRVGVMGMSFGGSTAAGFCLRDRRCKAGVNLDAMAWDLAQVDSTIPAPFMVLQSDPRARNPKADPRIGRTDFMYEKLTEAGTHPAIYRFRTDGTTHGDYSDFTGFIRSWPRRKWMRLGPIEPGRAWGVVDRFVLDFFDTHLRGIAVGFPDRALADYPEVHRHDVAYVRNWAVNNQSIQSRR